MTSRFDHMTYLHVLTSGYRRKRNRCWELMVCVTTTRRKEWSMVWWMWLAF
ncbi:hypothetical protein JHK86_018062 [Glycine max]|nr:hypothetical protein JHK86_018062 [Glycine max]